MITEFPFPGFPVFRESEILWFSWEIKDMNDPGRKGIGKVTPTPIESVNLIVRPVFYFLIILGFTGVAIKSSPYWTPPFSFFLVSLNYHLRFPQFETDHTHVYHTWIEEVSRTLRKHAIGCISMGLRREFVSSRWGERQTFLSHRFLAFDYKQVSILLSGDTTDTSFPIDLLKRRQFFSTKTNNFPPHLIPIEENKEDIQMILHRASSRNFGVA